MLLAVIGGLSPMRAQQITMPSITVAVDAPLRARLYGPSAAEVAHRVLLKQTQLEYAISFRDAHYPKDSLLNAVAASAAAWWADLQARPITGLQHDPAGLVSVAAGHEAAAQAEIQERLADPKLTPAERAYTYLIAVHGFANAHYPERLPVAEAYLKDLAALGPDAAPWQYAARATLVDVYYALGRTADIARHGMAAIALLPKMAYVDQNPNLLWHKLYVVVIQALAALPQGRARIDTVNALLHQTIAVPPNLLALDSLDLVPEQQWRQALFNGFVPMSRVLGTVGGPITGDYWINRPTTDSGSIAVPAGKITLFEPFAYTCDGCLAELVMLQRLKVRYPDIEVIGATFTLGAWGNRFAEPRDEAMHVAEHFLKTLKLTVPVAIVFGNKTLNEDGGMSLPQGAWYGPNYDRYPLIGKSPVWVMDGHGRIRQVVVGPGNDRENEEILARTIEFLHHEAATPHQ